MENILIESAKQVPSLAVLAIILYMVFNHLRESGDAWRATIMQIHTENLEARAVSREVISLNTEANRQNTIAMTQLTVMVSKLEKQGNA